MKVKPVDHGSTHGDTAEARRLLFTLTAAMVILAAVVWDRFDDLIRMEKGGFPGTAYTIDLNRAGPAELTLIPGIGPRLAEEIVRYREKSGPFKTLSDLERVRGIGPVRAAETGRWAFVDESEAPPAMK